MGLPTLAEVSSAHLEPSCETAIVSPDDLLVAELAASQIDIPDVPVKAVQFRPDQPAWPGPAEITDTEHEALLFCLSLGRKALEGGNPPVGAVLLDNLRGLAWAAMTVDKTTPDILGHAEVRAYNAARTTVGDQLQDCTLVTTAQPCHTCTCPYAEGKIGRVVFAAPRSDIYQVSGLMRPRKINMPDLLRDGNTNTLTIQGHLAGRALTYFATWGALRSMGKIKG